MQFGYGVPSQIYLRIMGLPPPEGAPTIFCWDLRVVCLDWTACLYAVNCETRYAVFLHHIPPDPEELQRSLLAEIRLQMAQDGFGDEMISAYFSAAGEIAATGLHGPYRPAESDHLMELLSWREVPFTDESFGQPFLRKSLNRWFCPFPEPVQPDGPQGDWPDQRMVEAVRNLM